MLRIIKEKSDQGGIFMEKTLFHIIRSLLLMHILNIKEPNMGMKVAWSSETMRLKA